MSMWAKVDVMIRSLDTFKQVITDEGLRWLEASECRRNTSGLAVGGFMVPGTDNAYSPHAVLEKSGDRYLLKMDTDPSYSPIAAKYGRTAEKLMQKYSIKEVERAMGKQKATLLQKKTTNDGSVVMRYKVA